jgi:trimethylamine--corrinoid protein Co-methyltransferase
VIDNDMLGSILRTVRGIEVTEASLSLEAMREVCLGGPNHFLGHDQTLELMQAEYLYPEIACRRSPQEWLEHGREDILDHAKKRLHAILGAHYPTYIPPALDRQLRQHFPIRLPEAAMRPGNDRW